MKLINLATGKAVDLGWQVHYHDEQGLCTKPTYGILAMYPSLNRIMLEGHDHAQPPARFGLAWAEDADYAAAEKLVGKLNKGSRADVHHAPDTMQ